MPTQLKPAPFFVLRTPLLPFDEWLALADGLGAAAGRNTLAADRSLARQKLRSLVERADVREALFVASPSLDEALAVWLQAPDSKRGLKAERSLIRYVARMCGRATPFGLFAGCAVGRVDAGAPTRLQLAARDHYRRHTRLDMDYLFALCETLVRDGDLRGRLRYRPSSSLYRAGGRLRYLEARLNGKERSYHLVAVEPSEYVEAALAQAVNGATLADIAAVVAARAEVGADEARQFVDELVAQQLLVPDLEVPVTGPEPIHTLLRRLEGHATHAPLARAHAALAEIDAQPLGVPIARYRAIADALAALPVPVELSRLFQVDLITAGDDPVLGGSVAGDLVAAVELLHRMAAPNDALRRFREAFIERYESAEVPLAEALDDESGIGFLRSSAPSADTSPLIQGLPFGHGDPEGETKWGAREQLLIDKLLAAARRDHREIVLAPADLDRLATRKPPPLPDSLAARVTLGEDGDIWLHSVSGPSGANLLGRFCHGDARLDELVRAELRAEEEQRPDAILAEVVHLPEGRVGNVLLRPLLREWELPLLGASGAPGERQLPLSDLTVAVVGDRVIMRSRRLGREIVPRLTSAHNYSHPLQLGIYRFLCMLQAQGVASGLSWSWGALASASFLPRVRCGRVVLEGAHWRLDRDELAPLAEGDDDARWAHVQSLRRTRGLPRFVALEDGDNRLPVDLDHVLSVDAFAHLVKQRDVAVLGELHGGVDALIARGPEGGFVHELIVPLRSGEARPPKKMRADAVAMAASERRVLPGGDCLYVKLYAGAASVDQLLRAVVAPIVRGGAIDRWFFIRYGDPDWHLRLRLFGDAAQLHGEVLRALSAAAAPLVDAGVVWRAQLDTYHREVERYGGPAGVRLCEQLFCADSEAVLSIVESLDGDAGADARWRLALLGIDRLLDDLGVDLDGKLKLMTELRNGLGREFAIDGDFEKQLGARFRTERPALEALLARELPSHHPLAPGRAILVTRSARQRPIAQQLRAGIVAGSVHAPLPSLAGSLVHMHANRMLRASQRANELVLYDFLKRLYEGKRARSHRSQ